MYFGTTSAICSFGAPCSFSPYATLLNTLFQGKRPKCWKTMLTQASAR